MKCHWTRHGVPASSGWGVYVVGGGVYAASDPALWPSHTGEAKRVSPFSTLTRMMFIKVNLHVFCLPNEAVDLNPLLFPNSHSNRKSTGKADICWLDCVSAVEWMLADQQAESRGVIALSRWNSSQLGSPEKQAREHLKRHEGQNSPSHEPRGKDASEPGMD